MYFEIAISEKPNISAITLRIIAMTDQDQNQDQNQRNPKDAEKPAQNPAQNPSGAERGAKPAQGTDPTTKA